MAFLFGIVNCTGEENENFCYYVSCFDDWHIYEEINSVKRCRHGLDISILCPNSELDTEDVIFVNMVIILRKVSKSCILNVIIIYILKDII